MKWPVFAGKSWLVFAGDYGEDPTGGKLMWCLARLYHLKGQTSGIE